MNPFLRGAVFCISLLQLWGCTISQERAAEKICKGCAALTLDRYSDIPLIAYTRMPGDLSNTVLHVYIEGDGLPWRGFEPSKNPTSTTRTALSLMQQDPNPSAYINRPCYGSSTMPAACEPSLWTDRRYSAEIVSRLNRALDELVALTESTDLFLFGHSGGGTLAMLLAGDRNDVRGIVSIAANLDHRLWTQTRGFRPLAGSLNPVELPPLTDGVARMHLAGANDRQVPAEIVELASRLDPRAIYRVYDNFDHHCCWNRVWPAVIREIQHRAASPNAMPAAQRTSEGTK